MPIPKEVIEEVKNRLVSVYDPLKIYIFGSYAWGSPTDESDLDLLIVIEESDKQRHKRSKPGYEALWGMGISKDLMVYTQHELERHVDNPSSLIYKILKDGKVLYAKS